MTAAVPAYGVDYLHPQRMLATGCAALDAKLIDWLGRHEDERFLAQYEARCAGVEVWVCELLDRGIYFRALSYGAWEDAVRNCLHVALISDRFEQENQERTLYPEQSLTLEQWLLWRAEQ